MAVSAAIILALDALIFAFTTASLRRFVTPWKLPGSHVQSVTKRVTPHISHSYSISHYYNPQITHHITVLHYYYLDITYHTSHIMHHITSHILYHITLPVWVPLGA